MLIEPMMTFPTPKSRPGLDQTCTLTGNTVRHLEHLLTQFLVHVSPVNHFIFTGATISRRMLSERGTRNIIIHVLGCQVKYRNVVVPELFLLRRLPGCQSRQR